jgi:hypothetical protein
MSERNGILVLWDNEGDCYLLTTEALAQARVPAERAAELLPVLGGDDVSGYLTPIPIPGAFDAGGKVGAGGKTAISDSPFAAGGQPRPVQGLLFTR